MWISSDWKDYELLDCGGGERLERWGKYLLVRPDPQAIWRPEGRHPGWRRHDARYQRASTGGGQWVKKELPQRWTLGYKGLTLNIKPMNFKHTGVFPEQAANWDFAMERIRSAGRPIRVLNLFAYTHPLDRGRLRQVRGAGDPPGPPVRCSHHGPPLLRPGSLRRDLEAGGEPLPFCGTGSRGALGRTPVFPH